MSCNKNTPNVNKTFIVEGKGNPGFVEHTISDSYKAIASNDMYLIWGDLTIESGSTVSNDGRVVVVNGDFNNFGSYSGTGTFELLTTDLEYILNYGNQTNGNLIYYTNSPSGWSSGDTIGSISSATDNVLVTKEWVSYQLSPSANTGTYTTGSTLINNTLYFDRNDVLSAYTVDLTDIRFSGGSGNCIADLYVTNVHGCSPITFHDPMISLSGITLSGAPTNDNTLTEILARDTTTGELKYRDVASIISAATPTDGNGITIGTGGTVNLGGVVDANQTLLIPTPLGANTFRFGDANGNGTFSAFTRVDTITNLGQIRMDMSTPDSRVYYEYISDSFATRTYANKAGNVDMYFNPNSTFSGITYSQGDSPSSYLRTIYLTDSTGTGSTTHSQGTVNHQLSVTDANNYSGNITVGAGLTQIFSQDVNGLASYSFSPNLMLLVNKDFAGIISSSNSTQLQSNFTNILWLNDGTNNDNILVDGTTNKRGLRYTNFGESDVSGTSANYSTLVGTSLIPKKYFEDNNIYVTGGTYSGNTIILNRFNDSDISITGITTDNFYTTGSTLIGDTVYFDRTDSLSAYTLDLSSLDVNDTFITGMTFNPANYQVTATRNDGFSTSPIDLSILSTDVTITGGTYDIGTGVVTFTNNSGGTFDVSGFTSGMTDSYTTAATLSGNSITFDNNINGSNFYNVDLTPILSGFTNTDGNGTTANGSAVDLGGTLYKNTVISGGSQNLSLGVDASQLSSLNIRSIQGVEHYKSGGLGLVVSKNPGTFNSTIDYNSVNGLKTTIQQNPDNVTLFSYGSSGSTFSYLQVKENIIQLSSVDNSVETMKFGLDRTNQLAVFTDSRTTTKGIEYAADYSTGYTPLSLITYQDLTGTTLSGGNGITIGTGNTIDLGGLLSEPFTVLSGGTTAILDLGGNTAGANLAQGRINATSFQVNNLTAYDGSGVGTAVNSNPGSFSITNNLLNNVGTATFGGTITLNSVDSVANRTSQLAIEEDFVQLNATNTSTGEVVVWEQTYNSFDLYAVNSGATELFRLKFDRANSKASFIDSRPTTSGIEYDSDYSSGYTDNSLITLRDLNLATTGLTDYYTTGGTYNSGTESIDFSGNNVSASFSVDVSSLLDDTNTYITGFTYDGANTFTIVRNDLNQFSVTINTMTGLTVDGIFSATTISGGTLYGDGSNLTGVNPPLNTGEIFVGDATNSAQSVEMTGDVNIDVSGVTTIQPDSVTYNKMQDVSQAAILGNESTSGGTVTEIPIVEQYLSAGVVTALLEDTGNWDINGVYIGTGITGTYQGQSHYDGNYWFTAVADNVWIRLIRG